MIRDAGLIAAWYKNSRRRLSGRGLWLLGGEPGTMPATSFETARLRVLIVRLSSYQDTAAGITHSFLYQLARSVDGVFADMAFLPPERDERLMRDAEIPLLVGSTTKRAALDFDVIAISNAVVQELVNLPALLHGSGIPLTRESRTLSNSPFLLLGGSNSYATAILHGPVGSYGVGEGLIDGVIAGDGEDAFPQFLRVFAAAVQIEKAPHIRLKLLRDEVPGFYDPSSYREHYDMNGQLSRIEATPGAPFPVLSARARGEGLLTTFTGGPIPYDEDNAGVSHLLVSAGCPYFCSFCKESWEQKPYRERESEKLITNALQLKASMGLSELNLMTFNANTFTGLGTLLDALESRFARVSIKSQRFDSIARSPRLLDQQIGAGKRTYTCAMEGISERLRTYLRKNLSETILLTGFKELFSRNIRQMKVFIIVTGCEETADYDEFATFLSKLKSMTANLKGKPLLTFSMAALFRPPHTPLQFEAPRRDPGLLESIFTSIGDVVGRAGFESRVSAGPWDAGVSEFIAWSDRRSTPVLVKASIEKGFRYRGEVDRSLYQFWQEEISAQGLNRIFFSQARNLETTFPWDDVDVGVIKSYLWKSYTNLMECRDTIACLAEPLGSGKCDGCGACLDVGEREQVTLKTAGAVTTQARKSMTGEEKPISYLIEARIPERWADVGNRFLFAALTRYMLRGKPIWTPYFIKFTEGIDRGGASGYFAAGFLMRSYASGFNTIIDLESINRVAEPDGVNVIAVTPQNENFADSIPELTMKIEIAKNEDPAAVSRRIDKILAKYRLKHQKRRLEKFLVWELNSGHAKKEGIARIRMSEGNSGFEIDLIHSIEPHLIGQLAGDGLRELVIREAAQQKDEAVTNKPVGMGRRRNAQ
ncbi:MAG: hypothetical protein HQM09_20735 [Candidatus Riflebacteria bacterium]|nr:hypothetical protein [Candidatus Riflebacteria bacterium]